jgi:hypothetical protein
MMYLGKYSIPNTFLPESTGGSILSAPLHKPDINVVLLKLSEERQIMESLRIFLFETSHFVL